MAARLPSLRRRTTPAPILARDDVQLLLTSACILFTELAVIRWIPSLVTYVGFFSNFLLMASFLGIGLGILLGRNGVRLPASPFPFLLLATMLLVTAAQLNVQVRGDGEIFFGLAESTSADVNFVVLPLVVILVTALMAVLALPLGPLLRSMPPLQAYAIDIGGSLVGIAAFAAMSLLSTPPAAWFSVVALLLTLMALGRGFTAWSLVGGLAMMAVIYGGALSPPQVEQFWSPYYRIDVYEGERGITQLSVNGIPHQSLHPADDERKNAFYEQIYRWFPNQTFDSVLIVGAGTGTDAAVALSRGAVAVDAVEIDPVIQRIGAERHPNDPYGDPRVTSHGNDGRAFLRTNQEQYDLIIFALPDSLTLVSTTANLRLESFLFTEEAFASVREHLTDDGVFILYNYYRESWLISKLASQLENAFEHKPLIRLYDQQQAALAAGPLVTSLRGEPPGERADPRPSIEGPAEHATDDWPFLYLREPFIAPYYLVALGFMIVLAVGSIGLALRRTGASAASFSPHFFALGAAFLLLETKSLVSFSLLFGTTWIVNALAFFAILLSVLLSIAVTTLLKPKRVWPFYIGLLLSLLLAFVLPPEQLLLDPPPLRYALAASVAFAPVFFANLVFTYSFRDVRSADIAFASNLIGAMVGGLLEYLALLTGYRWLVVVVAVVYVIAYLFASRWRLLGDRALVAGQAST